MKLLARIAIPNSTNEEIMEAIAAKLNDYFSFIEFEFESGISHPKMLSFDRNGVNLGSINGNSDAPSIALFGAIYNEVNRVFHEERAKESR